VLDAHHGHGVVDIAFETSWDLHKVKPNLFRVPPSVVFGIRAKAPVPLPADADHWSGRLPARNVAWSVAAGKLTQTATGIEVGRDAPNSPYHARFSQGATLVPRMLLVVEPAPASPIGVAAGRLAVRAAASAASVWTMLTRSKALARVMASWTSSCETARSKSTRSSSTLRTGLLKPIAEDVAVRPGNDEGAAPFQRVSESLRLTIVYEEGTTAGSSP
jgi:hypothetical protein